MQTIIHSVLLIVATGLVGGVILVIGSRLFSVEVDSRLWHVIDMLPGLNCGSCGNPGCAGYASAILAGAPCDLCGPGGEATANAIALYLGRDPGHTTVRKAVVTCNGAADRLRSVEAYEGDPSCRVFDLMGYMTESCTYGCLGLGDCVASCPFDAIRINGNHVAAIDVGRCTACGICVDVCPRHVIAIHERSQTDSPSVVLCCNTMMGKRAQEACANACIGCGRCVGACPEGCITVMDHVARINDACCTGCGSCIEVCPAKAIRPIDLSRREKGALV